MSRSAAAPAVAVAAPLALPRRVAAAALSAAAVALRALALCVAVAAVAAPLAAPLDSLHAQRARKEEREPRRPRFTIARDSNSAGAYYYHGMSILGSKPTEAADAFYWASRLDPEWADPLYARRVALHLADAGQLADYYRGLGGGSYRDEWKRIDSLQHRALLLDPFLYRRLDKDLLERVIDEMVVRNDRDNGGDGSTMPVRLRSRDAAFGNPRFAGWLAYGEGRFGEAIGYYATALKRHPKAYDIHSDRADAFFLMAQYDSAIASLGKFEEEMRKVDDKKLLPFYDSKAFVEYEIGRAHVARGDLAAAREAYGRALTEDLSFYMAHAALAEVALAQHDTATALSEYDLAVQIKGDEPGLRYRYGAMLFAAAKYDAAAEQFQRSIEADPWYAKPYFPLAYIRDGQGNDAEATRYYEGYVTRAPAADGARVDEARRRLAELRAAAPPNANPPGTAAPAGAAGAPPSN